jgi:L-alanine-DL-glutamate epimerase-like enolase superfamily enzyme
MATSEACLERLDVSAYRIPTDRPESREPERDVERVHAVREAVGEEVELFVDANGAYDRKQALRFAEAVADLGVSWMEEPVSSDDLEGLRLIRDRAPAGMEVTAGEYGYDLFYFRRMLEAGAVDVLQADITRCGGVTELLRIGALCDARSLPLSGHTAPALHAHVACAMPSMRHLEYFHDHVRIEERLFDGVLKPTGGALRPDRSRSGIGLEFRRGDAEQFRV